MYEQFNRIALEAALRHMLGEDGFSEGQELYNVLDARPPRRTKSLRWRRCRQCSLWSKRLSRRATRLAGTMGISWVSRVRVSPDVADDVCEAIIDKQSLKQASEAFLEGSAKAVAEQDDTMPLPEFYQGDSGDEDPYCVACGEYLKSCVGCE
jgi:hypothetical protein